MFTRTRLGIAARLKGRLDQSATGMKLRGLINEFLS